MSSVRQPTPNVVRGKEYTPDPEVKFYNTIVDLKRADDPFVMDDLPDVFRPRIISLIVSGGVEVVGERESAYDLSSKTVQEYSLTDSLLEDFEAYNPQMVMPCGHRGFENLRDGDYACKHEQCEAQFSQEEVKEVFG